MKKERPYKKIKIHGIIFMIIFYFTATIGCNRNANIEKPDEEIQVGNNIEWTIESPPERLNLDPFYKKYVYVNGIHVMSSWRVPDSALFQACEIILYMTDALKEEVRNELKKRDTRVGVMARYEGTTDIPEHAFMAKDTSINMDVRARGLGGDVDLPLTTCAEENLLCYQIDKYHAEDILIHEFAHTIHGVGILPIEPGFNDKLQKAFDEAIENGKWARTYAKTNIWEYWAEGVQDWFNVNAEVEKPDGKHNHVNTRKELKGYDKGLYDIISQYFSLVNGDISCHAVK